MKHLTHTGHYAGIPFCGINRQEAMAYGDTFCHVPYSNVDKFFALHDICHECKEVWFDDGDVDE